MRLPLFVTILALVVLAYACGGRDDVPYSPSAALVGERCDASVPFACQGDTLKICGSDGYLASESCADVCAQQGLTYDGACELDATRGHPFCRCKSSCCTEGARSCADETTLATCHACKEDTIDCSRVCDVYGVESEGCDTDPTTKVASCSCPGIVGGFCGADFVKCSESPISFCDPSETHGAVSCRELCESQGLSFGSCRLDATKPVEVCQCSNSTEPDVCKTVKPTCSGVRLAACVNGGVQLISCDSACNNQGLAFVECTRDPDRGHDVCLCAATRDSKRRTVVVP